MEIGKIGLFVVGCLLGFAMMQSSQSTQPAVWTNAELESAITAAIEQGTPVTLPAKTILTQPVNLGLKSTLRFQGAGGRLINYNQTNVTRTGGSRIYWQGAPDQPMFITAGVGNEWSGITFVFDKPTAAAIHIVKGSGLGSGKHIIDSCSFLENPVNRNQSTGVVFGVTIGDGNCDETTIKESIFVDTKSMVESRNHQSVGNKFYGNQTIRNAVVFNAAAGGKWFTFGHSSIRDQTILRLGQQGSGNNNFSIAGLSVDAGAPAGWLLIDNPLSRNVFVTIDGHLSSQAGKPRAELITNDKPMFDVSRLAGVRAVPVGE